MVPLTGVDGRCGGWLLRAWGSFGQDAGEPQLSKDKHAADTSLVPPSKLRNFGKMDEGIKAYPFLTKLLPAKQERM